MVPCNQQGHDYPRHKKTNHEMAFIISGIQKMSEKASSLDRHLNSCESKHT